MILSREHLRLSVVLIPGRSPLGSRQPGESPEPEDAGESGVYVLLEKLRACACKTRSRIQPDLLGSSWGAGPLVISTLACTCNLNYGCILHNSLVNEAL